MVFYLKYRPRKISELDSQAIQERLSAALKGKLPFDTPHAFLFTGPKGLGKTSTARIVAKSINCTNRKKGEIEPCNKCASCKAIDAGSSLDVMEIDGASNRGIDEIRDLREKIRLSPVNSLKKIYIIDEVHMLTTEAFNALLKTLEEPPKHAQFILCTTEPHKIPETISSRCFNIKFSRATQEDLIHSFKRIIRGEKIEADKDALSRIAELSDGSFRDGAKILEEISLGSKKINTRAVEEKYNFENLGKSVQDLISALFQKDINKSIKIINILSDDSTDFKYFNEQLLNTLHNKLISELEEGQVEARETKELISTLIKSYGAIRYAPIPQLPLELAVVEWCINTKKGAEMDDENKSQNEDLLEAKKTIKEKTISKIVTKDDKILESLIEKVKKDNFSIAGVLRGCEIEKNGKDEIILSTEYKFHKERLSEKKVIDMIEKNLTELTGNKAKVNIILRG